MNSNTQSLLKPISILGKRKKPKEHNINIPQLKYKSKVLDYKVKKLKNTLQSTKDLASFMQWKYRPTKRFLSPNEINKIKELRKKREDKKRKSLFNRKLFQKPKREIDLKKIRVPIKRKRYRYYYGPPHLAFKQGV